MVYRHPRYVSSAPHLSNGRLGGLFISPTEKVAIGDEVPLSATDQTLTSVRSALTGRVRSRKRLSGTLLVLTGLWHLASCATSCAASYASERSVQRSVATVDSAVAEPLDRSV